MAKLKPWYDVVELREDLRENRPLDASEFAIHLDQIRDGRAHKDYTDPQRFFDRTYVTGSLLDLASQVLQRLSGVQVETSAVFNMATQFGGGKSRSLTRCTTWTRTATGRKGGLSGGVKAQSASIAVYWGSK